LIEGEPPAKDPAAEHALWDAILADEKVDEIAVHFKNNRALLRWRYAEGPNHYRWFDL
jgi:hypothetical protein